MILTLKKAPIMNLNNTSAHNKDASHKFSQLMEGVLN